MLNAYKDKLDALTPEQLEIAIGVMLDDASLQTQNNGKTYRMKFEQGNAHVDYINHLYSKFSEWCLTKPNAHSRTNAAKNVVTNWTFQTISHPAFVPLATICFHKKIQITSIEILVEGIKKKYNLACWRKENKKRSVVAISGNSYSQMIELMEKFIIPELRSKLLSPRRLKRAKLMT